MRKLFALILVAAALAVAVGMSLAGGARASAPGPLSFSGVTVVSALPSAVGTTTWSPTDEFIPDHEPGPASNATPHSPNGDAPHTPTPWPSFVVQGSQAGRHGGELVTSFQGLNHFDQRTANGGNQFSLEPPDQGLCTGNGFVLETVNDVMRVYDTLGNGVSSILDMNSFFGLPAQINRSTGIKGDFLSDPKCYYDTGTGRFFLTELQEDSTRSVSAHTLIAVSQSSDPTGAWSVFRLAATDDGTEGTPVHTDCPCFGDQPLIGADKYGFYVSTNEYSFSTLGFNGAQVYAMSKTALESGAVPAVVQFESPPLAEGPGYSIQPATSPSPENYSRDNGGTEYFLSALDFTGTLDNRIAAWSITNTSSLNSATPSVSLQSTVMHSESYGQPPAADQKSGPHPFGEWGANYFYGGALNQPVNTLNANDDRMNQVVYAGGDLWGAVNTVVQQKAGALKSGIAWFRVEPQSKGWDGNQSDGNHSDGKGGGHHTTGLSARVVDQGYVAVWNNNVLFPSIGVTPRGNKAVMTMTLSGPDYYPTSAYTVLRGDGFGQVQIAGLGVGPADGFTGYDPFAPDGIERWGDYSAAVSGQDGTVWIASENIAQSCTVAQYQLDTTCGGTRTTLANWATRVSAVRP